MSDDPRKEKPFSRNPHLGALRGGYPDQYANLSAVKNMQRKQAAQPQGVEKEQEVTKCIGARIARTVVPGQTPAEDEETSRLAVMVYRQDHNGMAGKQPNVEVIHDDAELFGLSTEEKQNIDFYCIESFSDPLEGNPDAPVSMPATGDWVRVSPPADGVPDDECRYLEIQEPGPYSTAGSKGPSARGAFTGRSGIPVIAEWYPAPDTKTLAELATNHVDAASLAQDPCMDELPDDGDFSEAGGEQPVFPTSGTVGRAFENHAKEGGSSPYAVDFSATQNTPVVSILDGEIIAIDDPSGTGSCGGSVSIKYIVNGKQLVVKYCHLSTVPSDSYPCPIKRGAVVGLSGGSPGSPGAGRTTGPHLHAQFSIAGTGATNDGIKELLGWDLLAADNLNNVNITAGTNCREKS